MPKALFKNPWRLPEQRLWDVVKWKMRGYGKAAAGSETPKAARMDLTAGEISSAPETGWRVVWLGHASFLIQGCGMSLLIDPVFSKHCGPFPIKALRRHVEPPCGVGDLPKLDAVLLTHSHYDHLDMRTLRALGDVPLIVAEGHGKWLRKKGFARVLELPWWECGDHGGVKITATPARHFTARTPFDWNRGHWCGWLIEGGGCKVWHAGDSGYGPAFSEIGRRFGPIDLGMIPIGAYAPRTVMSPVHMDPEEAVRAFMETGCRRAVPMHWGTFKLTDEPMGEPPVLLERALGSHGIPLADFRPVRIGEMLEVHFK